MSDQSAWERFRSEVEEAQDLLKHSPQPSVMTGNADSLTTALPNLLEQCRELAGGAAARLLRSVHHLACTGGTLISRCIAAMANTQVLSEVDPLSTFEPRSLSTLQT